MSLDLLPRRNTPSDTPDTLPRGMTHPAGTLCPFASDGFPISPTGTCCSLRGQVAVESLDALGEAELASFLDKDLLAETTPFLVSSLRAVARRFERTYRDGWELLKDARLGKRINPATGAITPWPDPAFEAAMASIRQAADWYEKVGRLGFDVHARH